jgi:hypothetical protein
MRFREHHLVLCLLLAAGLLRFFPHPAAMAPIGAMALFTGAYLQRSWLWLLPFAVLVAVDWLDGRNTGIAMPVTYVGFVAVTLLGRWLLDGRDSNSRILAAVPAAAFVCWLAATLGTLLAATTLTPSALAQGLWQALPTLVWHLLGDSLYALLLFGSYKLLREAPFVHYSPQS